MGVYGAREPPTLLNVRKEKELPAEYAEKNISSCAPTEILHIHILKQRVGFAYAHMYKNVYL